MNNQRKVISPARLHTKRQSRAADCACRYIVLPLLAVLLSGCRTDHASAPSVAYYYLNPGKTLTGVGRVAIVEMENNSSYPEISTDVTTALFQALQKKQVFGLTIVHRDDPPWRSLQLEGNSTYGREQMLSVRETLKCDGLMVGTVTEFRPFPHMAIGLRLKLLDLRDGQLLWALEQVWDSADKTTEKHIKEYFKSEKRTGFAPLHEQLAAVSPLEFIRFVSFEVAETL